jgi:hypothetical protein
MAMRDNCQDNTLRVVGVTQIYGKGFIMSNEETKDTSPSQPQQVTEEGEVLPVEVAPSSPPEELESFDTDPNDDNVKPDYEAELTEDEEGEEV